MEVLKLIGPGYSNSQIAERLCITIFTVKAHVQAILKKLRVKNRIQAAIIAAYYFEIKPEMIVQSANRLKVG